MATDEAKKSEDEELEARVVDKGKEVQDVLVKYSKTVDSWHKDKCAACPKANELEKVFDGAETVIVILGNILNPDGTPHEMIHQRLEKCLELIKSRKLDLKTTCFLPTGGAVSNEKYTYDAEKWKDLYKNYPHPSEATVMRDILHKKHNIPLSNITREEQARTTLENFYYVFKIFYNSKVKKLKNFFVITSDWHKERAKINFDILYEIEKELEDEVSIDGDIITRKFLRRRWFDCDNLEFVGAKSNAPESRFLKEKKLIAAKWVRPQAQEYSDYLWPWRDFNDAKNKPQMLKRQGTLGAFAFSTAIEHLYLRLDSAEHGLTKVVHR